jgi:hypothetical protein
MKNTGAHFHLLWAKYTWKNKKVTIRKPIRIYDFCENYAGGEIGVDLNNMLFLVKTPKSDKHLNK